MMAEALAELRRVMRGERSRTATAGVTVTPAVTAKHPLFTPVTPVTPETHGTGKPQGAESRTAARSRPSRGARGPCGGRVPAVYLDAWARLNCQKPEGVTEADWRRALDDGGRFLDGFGEKAAEIGWSPGELFDVGRGLSGTCVASVFSPLERMAFA